jgi:hypothetical protein
VQAAIDRAVASIPAEQRQSPRFVLDTANTLLKQSAAEYQAAVADGKFVNVAEYQDSLGFVTVARDLVADVAIRLKDMNSGAYQDLVAALTELQKAWPSPMPPARPVVDVSEVYSNVSRVELISSDFR